MDPIYISAFAALAGSVLGSGLSLLSAWLIQYRQEKERQISQDRSRRQELYRQFIDEGSKLYADAIVHEQAEVAKLVGVYALIGQMRIQSSTRVIARADEVVRKIIETYASPNMSFSELCQLMGSDAIDPLRCFSEECRAELHQMLSPPGRVRYQPTESRTLSYERRH